MLSYEPPVDEYMFLFKELVDLDKHRHLRGFADLDIDVVEAVLTEAGKLAREVMLPLNAVADREGCTRHPDGSVTTPTGFGDAYRAYAEGGWAGLAAPEQYGGQDFPKTFATAVMEFRSASNQSFDMYTGWGDSIAEILMAHGTPEQCETYLTRLITGEWGATMGLTEPHCGTDVGLLRTRATPQPDGSYKITGTKIFNSGGEHDLTDNIIHFVLARIDGDAPGSKGISLFLMPKNLPSENGEFDQRNAVSCGSIEHKMGLNGSATCVMNYDEAKAWLVGEPRHGLMGMFKLMNAIRRRTGTMAVGVSELATQNAVAYTKERLQGRSLSGPKQPEAMADPLIVQPDVRRTLMKLKSFNEGARALLVWSGLIADVVDRAPDKAEAAAAEERLALITPVIKAYLSDEGFDNAVSAQQMFGGHGYVAETGIEQLVRDCRMLAIAEGANGVQGVDLVLRKLGQNKGQAAFDLIDEIGTQIQTNRKLTPSLSLVDAMARAIDDMREATTHLVELGGRDREAACTGATDYIHLTGLVLIGYMWLRLANAATRQIDEGKDESGEMAAKLMRARFFAERMLPETSLRLTRIKASADNVMALEEQCF
ncbi:acyl-CoA dehydrogenase [Aurantiacibacter atlanticus]|uniref:3-methylmercaptopropionyl-CoA dehydrogenase n=1 Tax=Aurantiacibacter atlanticus TaxID=1648404 RepID=A0A0H4VBT2_9SPHN|nr:acyl-CoA dehydrogenase C-terminal domain-containing protein [Aurantiacibacter atlanticus]AKQ42102.1 acyl-CoA dehydrogenase [Aurantiacibacter atlanticus]